MKTLFKLTERISESRVTVTYHRSNHMDSHWNNYCTMSIVHFMAYPQHDRRRRTHR